MNGQRKAVRNFRVVICSLMLMAVLAILNPQPTRGQPITFGDPAFRRQWEYSDKAVSEERVTRSWLWGPKSLGAARPERMVGSPAHGATPADNHLVQYFDKARMEFNAEEGIVTNGRLVVELMSGVIQISLTGGEYFPLLPSTLPIAGDTALGVAHTDTPTYAHLFRIANIGGSGPQATPRPVGASITATYARSGTVGTLPANAVPSDLMPRVHTFYSLHNEPNDPLGHNIPNVFMNFLTQQGLVWSGTPGQYRTDYLFEDNTWVTAVGLPITEPYWVQMNTKVETKDANGTITSSKVITSWVMFQAFERRILTYNPSSTDPLWRVEMGNVGQHYKDWRPEPLVASPLGGVQVVHSSPNPKSDVCFGDGAIDGSCPEEIRSVPRGFLTVLRTTNSWARTKANGWMLLHSDNAIYDMQSSAMLLFKSINNSVDSVQQQGGQVDYLHGPKRRIEVDTGTGEVDTYGTLFSIILPAPNQAGGEALRIVVPRQGGSVRLTGPNLPAPGQIEVQSGQVLTALKGPPISYSVRLTTPAEEQYWVDKLNRLQGIPEVKELARLSQVSGATPVPNAPICPAQFADVATSDALSTAARCLVCRDSLNAYVCGGPNEPCNANRDPYFRPQDNVTRGQIARAVSDAAGYAEAAGTRIYEDVPETNPYFTAIQRLSHRGLVGGYQCAQVADEPCVGPGNRPYFRPNGSAAQGLVAKVVSEAAKFQEPVSGQTFQDVPPTHTFYVFIERLASRKIMLGYPCGGPGEPCGPDKRPYLRPQSSVTRGQLSLIAVNTFLPNCQTASRGRPEQYEAGDASNGS